MAEHTIFGSGAPAGDLAGGASFADAGDWVVGTAFHVSGVTGWRAIGARFYVGAWAVPSSGYKAYLWEGTTVPTTLIATANFGTVANNSWNEVDFDTPADLEDGRTYWVAVYFPTGVFYQKAAAMISAYTSADAPLSSESISKGNGWYSDTVDAAPATSSAVNAFYGIDVTVDEGLGPTVAIHDQIGMTDQAAATRGGLPSTIDVDVTVTDPLGASDSDSGVITVGAGTGIRTQRLSIFQNRVTWGSSVDNSVLGPTLDDDLDGGSEFGCEFALRQHVRIVGCRIYKHPDLAGAVPVSVWTGAGVLLAQKTVTMIADGGGWREITFDAPVDAPVGVYSVSYFPPNGKRAWSPWVFNGQPWVVGPFVIDNFRTPAAGPVGGVTARYGSHGFPNTRTPHNWYVDPIIEWDDTYPGYEAGTEYFDQWENGGSAFAFPVAVFFADEEFLSDYASIGINTLYTTGFHMPQSKVDAIKAAGLEVIANVGDSSISTDLTAVIQQAEDPAFAALLRGYFLVDEPDISQSPHVTAEDIVYWIQQVRLRDSTRPVFLNLSYIPVWNQGFFYQPPSITLEQANAQWRSYGLLADVFSCDMYTLTPSNQGGRFGLWDYPDQIGRMRTLSEGRVPIWGFVETTSQDHGLPEPEPVRRAVWAQLIAGARGIVFFDHRFADADDTQDFAAMLHDPGMRAMVAALAPLLQTLAPALHAADAGLVSAAASSNTTAGPVGGTYGVPLHYTTRVNGATSYLFAMGIRPGATTATFTIPAAAGKTLTVIGESRTIDADGGGVFSDVFAADYSVHLYSWAT